MSEYLGTVEDVASGSIPGGYAAVNALQADGVIHRYADVCDDFAGTGCVRVERAGEDSRAVEVRVAADDLAAVERLAARFDIADGPGIARPAALALARKICESGPTAYRLDARRAARAGEPR